MEGRKMQSRPISTLFQLYVKHRRLIGRLQDDGVAREEETVSSSGKRDADIVESVWEDDFIYDYSADFESDAAYIVSLISNALCNGTDITTELVEEMCPNVCCQINELVRQWASMAGEFGSQIRIVTVIDVEEEVVDGGIRFDYGAQITRYAAADALANDRLCSFTISSSRDEEKEAVAMAPLPSPCGIVDRSEGDI